MEVEEDGQRGNLGDRVTANVVHLKQTDWKSCRTGFAETDAIE